MIDVSDDSSGDQALHESEMRAIPSHYSSFENIHSSREPTLNESLRVRRMIDELERLHSLLERNTVQSSMLTAS